MLPGTRKYLSKSEEIRESPPLRKTEIWGMHGIVVVYKKQEVPRLPTNKMPTSKTQVHQQELRPIADLFEFHVRVLLHVLDCRWTL